MVLSACLVLAISPIATAWADTPKIEDVGPFTWMDQSGSGAVKLSGITYAGGDTYHAVGGGGARVYTLHIEIDAESGAIRKAGIVGTPLQLNDESGDPITGCDLEGIALGDVSVYVADENGPRVARHDLTTGNRTALASPDTDRRLRVYSTAVHNRSWESLARAADGSALWTANEEALTVDGALATTKAGTVVRLQKFDANLTPAGQWAYVTDPIRGRSGSLFDRSGVVDLLALDDGRLVVMERSTGDGFRIRLYLADLSAATDVATAPLDGGLMGHAYTPVAKTLLFTKDITSRRDVNSYFVGLTLGPKLQGGARSIILIADNGGSLNFLVPNNQHTLYALRLKP
jgi:hypothetical protein